MGAVKLGHSSAWSFNLTSLGYKTVCQNEMC
jgi:hypothetical protein